MAGADLTPTDPPRSSLPATFEQRIQRRVGITLVVSVLLVAVSNAIDWASGERPFDLASRDFFNMVTLATSAAVLSFTVVVSGAGKVAQVTVLLLFGFLGIFTNDPLNFTGPAFVILAILLGKQYQFFERALTLKVTVTLAVTLVLATLNALTRNQLDVTNTGAMAAFIAVYLFLVWIIFAEEKKDYVARTAQLEEERRKDEVFVYFGKSIAGFAHNLRNVLTILAGVHAQIQTARDMEEVRDLSGYEYEAIRRIADTIEHMMMVTKAKQDTNRNRLNINSLIRGVVEFFNTDLTFKSRVAIELEMPVKELFAVVTPYQLSEVLENLIKNSFEAMAPDGSAADNRIVIATERVDDLVHVKVSDNGCGMAGFTTISNEECLRHFAVGKTTKEHGTGLGMLTILDACRENRWAIRVTTQQDIGTTVELTLASNDGENAHVWLQPSSEPQAARQSS